MCSFFFFQAEDGIRDHCVTGVQTCALPIWGPADALIEPEDEEALRLLMVQARKAKVPVFVLGGTNLLVRDGGIRGVVVRLTKFDRIEEHAGGLLYAQGGVGMPRLLKYALQRKLAGLEFAAGIPGTLAGAVVMN